ncbi:hypothetical protein [Scytonema sp. NUACC26]|uniref:hypothetical protein n=1 Tax=Scytonema sp. NUACC26 TaxID=3140176 RepID=UPI0034DBB1EF
MDNFNSDKIDESYIERALKLADGNPRLLEWLNNEVLSGDAINTKLSQYENRSEEWKEKIIWELENQPKLQLDEVIERVISPLLVYEIPVPLSALSVLSELISCYQEQLKRAINLGLIEVSLEPDETKQIYRVSRILPHIIPTIRLPEKPKVYSLYRKASDKHFLENISSSPISIPRTTSFLLWVS